MSIQPPQFDVWIVGRLARFLGQHPLVDIGVQSGIAHHILGGFWYAAAVFYFWVKEEGPNARRRAHTRILTALVGSSIAILFTLIAAQLVSWPPPSHNPALTQFYPDYLLPNINSNSFPSDSTAVYTAVALAIFTLDRLAGSLLLACVLSLVGIPRMYVGGHYATDVVIGAAIGVAGFLVARNLLERDAIPRLIRIFEGNRWWWGIGQFLVFAWMWQLVVEFREIVWISTFVRLFLC